MIIKWWVLIQRQTFTWMAPLKTLVMINDRDRENPSEEVYEFSRLMFNLQLIVLHSVYDQSTEYIIHVV